MEDVTSAKFRVFLAEKAVNYMFVANVEADIILTNTNIGCPNISFGPGISRISEVLIVDCEFYEHVATRALDKIIRFFEGGQSALLKDSAVEKESEPEEELNALGNWGDLREKIESGHVERLLKVGIGTGADDSEWFRAK
jgi:hypothetical protein